MSKKEKVLVAMSGGVDSSFAAACLRDQGFEVTGVHFQVWKPDSQIVSNTDESALLNAKKLGISFQTIDLRDQFRNEIVEYFINDYLMGKTPNPCSLCNPKIKFAALLKLADEMSAQYVATGHYARIAFDTCSSEYHLLEAKDKTKDQSYFLSFVDQKYLGRILFPLAEMTKKEVKLRAAEMDLPSAKSEESQDVCFVLSKNYAKVIEDLRPEAKKPGDMVDLSGKSLGRHKGICHYTIGQHRGLALNLEDLYVLSIDPAKNQVVVGKEENLFHKKMKVSGINRLAAFNTPLVCQAKIRYRSEKIDCRIEETPAGGWVVEFAKPQRAITPGQAAVFYRESRVVAGAWIEKAWG